MLRTRMGRLLGKTVLALTAVLAGFSGAPFLASPAQAQFTPTEIIHMDLGVFGLGTLATAMPSLVYRPMDDMNVRPGGAPQGMGGAYLARAQGPLAIGWEPAGLVFMDRTTIVVDGYNIGSSSSTRDYPDSFLVPDQPPLLTSSYRMNLKGGMRGRFMAAGFPLWESGNFRVAGAFSWRRYMEIIAPETMVSDLVFGLERSFPVSLSMDISERGAIESLAPSFAVQVHPSLALGANLNFLSGRLRAGNLRRISAGGFPVDAETEISFKYSGFVPDLGVRFLPMPDRLEFGARYSPSYTLKVRGGRLFSHSFFAPGQPLFVSSGRVPGYDLEIPPALGIGAAVRPLDRLWITADWNQHKWEDTKLTYKEAPQDTASMSGVGLPLRDVTSFHVGAEYLLFKWRWADLPVRVGFHTSPQSYAQLDRRDVEVDDTFAPLLQVTHSGTYNGQQVKTNAMSGGASLRTAGIEYDFGVETQQYKVSTWYLDVPYDIVANPDMTLLRVRRTVTRLHLSASYSF